VIVIDPPLSLLPLGLGAAGRLIFGVTRRALLADEAFSGFWNSRDGDTCPKRFEDWGCEAFWGEVKKATVTSPGFNTSLTAPSV
jgi:hypothetical protein